MHYGTTWKVTLLESVPLGIVTVIVPVVAPLGTIALMYVLDTTVNVAAVPLKLTAVVPVRLFPRMLQHVENSFVIGPTIPALEFGPKSSCRT